MNLSKAEIKNKIEQMQESIKDNIASKLIPKSQTDIAEPKIQKEEYKPMTASEYESKINKKPTIKVENRRGLIDELKEKLQKRKQTQMITEVFPEVNKRDVNKLLDNVLSGIIKKGIQKQDVLKIAETVVSDIITQSSRQDVLKIAEKVVDDIITQSSRQNYVDNIINKAISSVSSQATTASSEGDISHQSLPIPKRGDAAKETSALRNRINLAGISPNPLAGKSVVSKAELNKIESELIASGRLKGQGIKKNKSKK
jgi:hypothetical protein